MPPLGSLLRKVVRRKNLLKAWDHISHNAPPGSHGASAQTIQDFRSNLTANLELVRAELLSGNYRFGCGRDVKIPKKSGEPRHLKVYDIRDRVAQRAIAQVIYEPLTTAFHLGNRASFAYQSGRSTQTAIKQMLEYHQAGCKIVVEADIRDFFGTVDVQRLLEGMIFPKLSDDTLNQYIANAFSLEASSIHDPTDEPTELYPEGATGLPQGGYLSPLFSNVFLSEFDRVMLAEKYKLIRFADDFIVLCESEAEADDAYLRARQILEDDLCLEIHPRDDANPLAKTKVVRVSQNPIKFLGIQFNGQRLWPDGDKRLKLNEKMDRLSTHPNSVIDYLSAMRNLLDGWVASYAFTDINPDYSAKIDRDVNIRLWRTLKGLGWRLTPRSLNLRQRAMSGIRPARQILSSVRINLKDQGMFARYWTGADRIT